MDKARLPEDVAVQARAAGQRLRDEVAGRGRDNAVATALGLRNRAYWSLRKLMDQIRAGAPPR